MKKCFAVIVSLVLLLMSSSVVFGAQPNLVAYWNFDGNTNNQAGTAANGTLANGAYTYYGHTGAGLIASGGGHLDISNFTGLNNMTAFTITAWVCPSAFGSYNPIITKVSPNRDFVLQLTDTGKINAHFAINYNQYYHCTTDNPVPLNQWTYIAATWTGSGWKIYQNGVLVKAVAYSGVAPQWTGTVMEIGALANSYFFSGSIDEVKIIAGELTAELVKADYEGHGSYYFTTILGVKVRDSFQIFGTKPVTWYFKYTDIGYLVSYMRITDSNNNTVAYISNGNGSGTFTAKAGMTYYVELYITHIPPISSSLLAYAIINY